MTYYSIISNTGVTWELQRKDGDTWVTIKEFPYSEFVAARDYYYTNIHTTYDKTYLMENSNRLW